MSRPYSLALDKILGERFPVLDHGFVRCVDYMGNDASVVQAARVSYGDGTKTLREDTALIAYLMRMRHTSPFEMCEIKLHVKLPIFVARQWIRHRTANVNEYSGRYSEMPDESYLPRPEHICAQATGNMQGRGEALPDDLAERLCKLMKRSCNTNMDDYQVAIEYGLARELARIVLPLSTYTEWYWKTDLHNLLHFLHLRTDPHAQLEIRVYADVIAGIVEQWVPLTWAAWVEHRRDAVTLSATAMCALRRMLAGEAVTQESSGLGKREWGDLMAMVRGKADAM